MDFPNDIIDDIRIVEELESSEKAPKGKSLLELLKDIQYHAREIARLQKQERGV